MSLDRVLESADRILQERDAFHAENERLRTLLHDALERLDAYSPRWLRNGEFRDDVEKAVETLCQRIETELRREPWARRPESSSS